MKRYVAALRAAAEVVDVPGTPRTLRLDEVSEADGVVSVRWSFVDPEVHQGRSQGRLRGSAEFTVRGGRREVDGLARSWWREVQLAAGHRFVRQVDADLVPGAQPRRHPWTVEEAWQSLLEHLRASRPVTVEETDGGLRVVTYSEEILYRFSPDQWADYLNGVGLPRSEEQVGGSDGDDVVPAATGPVDELPVWAADDLDETAGAHGPVVTIVDGRLVGSDED